MKRREFIAATAALLVSPRRSWAQETLGELGCQAAARRGTVAIVPGWSARTRLEGRA